MFQIFLTSAYVPFAVTFVVMVGIGLIEALGLGVGHLGLDADADLPSGTVLDWLGVGAGLPILIWLTSLRFSRANRGSSSQTHADLRL